MIVKNYVYYIKNKTTGLKYIGVKFSKNADPKLFWKTYFTSSNLVKKLIKLYGQEDFELKILRTFESELEAIKYERQLLNYAVLREDYLNIHVNFITDSEELYFQNKNKQKKIACLYGKLSFLTKTGFHKFSKEEKIKVASKGGTAAAKVNKITGKGIFNYEARKKQHKTLKEKQLSAFYDPVLKQKISSMGGKVGKFSKVYRKKHNISNKEWIKQQSDRGKRGGIKNKGFRWYNNGSTDFKYTVSQQLNLSFEDFLKQNIQFKQGRNENKKNNFT